MNISNKSRMTGLMVYSLALLTLFSIIFNPVQAQDDSHQDWKTELEAAMEQLQEVLEEKQVHLEALQEHINEDVLREMEASMAQLEQKMALHEVEMQKIELQIQHEVAEKMAVVEAHMKELEVHFKEAEKQVKEYEAQLKEELVKDGLWEEGGESLHIEDEDGKLFINDQELTPSQQRKYRKLIDEFEDKVEKAFHIEHEY